MHRDEHLKSVAATSLSRQTEAISAVLPELPPVGLLYICFISYWLHAQSCSKSSGNGNHLSKHHAMKVHLQAR